MVKLLLSLLLVSLLITLAAVWIAWTLRKKLHDAHDQLHQLDFFRLVEKLPFGVAVETPQPKRTTVYNNQADIDIFGYYTHEYANVEVWLPQIFPDPNYLAYINQEKNSMYAECLANPQRGSNPRVWDVRCKNNVHKKVQFKVISFYGYDLWITTDVTALHLAQEKLEALARTDALTGLGNRTALDEHIAKAMQRAQRHHSSFAILYIDLDQFKPINDQYGHKAGDQVLCTVAKRFQSIAREIDAVIRLGGDEFVVLLDNVSTLAAAEVAVQRVKTVLKEAIPLENGLQVFVGASIGIALYAEHGDTLDTLLHHADQQMYRNKHHP